MKLMALENEYGETVVEVISDKGNLLLRKTISQTMDELKLEFISDGLEYRQQGNMIEFTEKETTLIQ